MGRSQWSHASPVGGGANARLRLTDRKLGSQDATVRNIGYLENISRSPDLGKFAIIASLVVSNRICFSNCVRGNQTTIHEGRKGRIRDARTKKLRITPLGPTDPHMDPVSTYEAWAFARPSGDDSGGYMATICQETR